MITAAHLLKLRKTLEKQIADVQKQLQEIELTPGPPGRDGVDFTPAPIEVVEWEPMPLMDMPELELVASTLDVHPQTLRRRLSKEGTSFSELKGQVRRDVALHFLGKQGVSIEEIAHRAGFSESSAFIRAFKGWTGVTPYTYRKGL